ncbi:TraR/DksA family transcriptional regulator [candidate division KSB1 bacterium]
MSTDKKNKYTAKELKTFKEFINKEKTRLLKKLDRLSRAAMETLSKDSTGDHSGYSLHMADQGTDSQEREKSYLFASRERKYLEKLDEALERINEGTYGICQECESKIDKERLEAVPISKLCYDCKSKQY